MVNYYTQIIESTGDGLGIAAEDQLAVLQPDFSIDLKTNVNVYTLKDGRSKNNH